MSQPDIIRAWRDEEYCNSLSDEQRAMLPENPAGVVELSDAQLGEADGGTTFPFTVTIGTGDFQCSLMYSCITLGCTITFGIDAALVSST